MQYNTLSINWQEMGRPDKGRIGELIESLPAEIRSQLSRPATEVLKEIIFLCWLMAQHSGRGTAYCFPGREYLAGKADRSVSTIKRIIGLMEDLGLISHRQRRPTNGYWSTNIYTPGTGLLAVMYARLRKLGTVFSAKSDTYRYKLKSYYRGSFLSRIGPKEEIYKRNGQNIDSQKAKEPQPPYHLPYQPPTWDEQKWHGPALSELFRQSRRGEMV